MRAGVFVFAVLLLCVLIQNAAAFKVVTPEGDDNYINEDTVINSSASPYYINDTNGNGVLIINASNVVLDCNGSEFSGDNGIISDTFVFNEGSNNVTIKNCNVYNYSNTFVFNNSVYGEIVNNTVKDAGSFLIMQNSNSSIIENNFIMNAVAGLNMLDSRYNLIAMNKINNTFSPSVWLLNSPNNVFASNNITGGLFGAIWLQVSPNNRIIQQDIGFSLIGIFVNESSDVTVENCTLHDNSGSDFNIFDSVNFQINNTEYQTLLLGWSLNLYVEGNSNPVSNASVTIYDNFSALIFSGQTDSEGFIYAPLLTLNQSATGTVYYNPYNITASKDGYYPNSTLVNVTESKTIHLTLQKIDPNPPVIDYSIKPKRQIRGETVSIFLNATDEFGVNSTWAVITMPNSSTETIVLANVNTTSYTAPIAGRYNVTIFANDSYGNTANVTDFFVAEEPLLFNATVQNYGGSNLTSTVEVYFFNTSEKLKDIQTDGNIRNAEMLIGNFDLRFRAFGDKLQVLLKNVSINSSQNKKLGLDRLDSPASGFTETYAVTSTFIFSQAVVRMHYNDSKLSDEDYIEVHRCGDWNFTNRTCKGNWSEIDIKSKDKNSNYVEVEVAGFSGFSIKQGPYCGDGKCDPDENITSCFNDCKCETGQKRACGDTDIGECKFGIQFCEDGLWGNCTDYTGPAEELCNRKDDDCDGIVDDVGDGDSAESTACQCYDDGDPSDEICDGIDNDCDGKIDEDLTRNCGTDEGVCEFGTSACIEGVWGECKGEVGPDSVEKCDNNLDDDCDGEIDEGCENIEDTCNNGVMDENEEGVDCGGVCPNKCFQFPWYILIVIGVVVLAAVAAYLLKAKSGEEKERWDELERKYSY
jgi:hypothetical protein